MAMHREGVSFLERADNDIFEIITRTVSANSYKDLISLSAASKTLRWRLRDYSGLLKYANIKTLLDSLQLSREQMHFVRDCSASGNLEALFWHGLYVLLQHDDWGQSSDLLKAAADKGHVLSMYTWGMLAIVSDEWNEEILRVLKDAEALESREHLNASLTSLLFGTPTFYDLVTRRNWPTLEMLEDISDVSRHRHDESHPVGSCQRCYWADEASHLLHSLSASFEDKYFDI